MDTVGNGKLDIASLNEVAKVTKVVLMLRSINQSINQSIFKVA